MDNGTFDLGDIEDIEIIDQTWDGNNIVVKVKPKEEDHGSPIRKIDQAAQLNPIEYLEAKKNRNTKTAEKSVIIIILLISNRTCLKETPSFTSF